MYWYASQTKRNRNLLHFVPEVKAKNIVVIPNGVADDYRLIDRQHNDEEFVLFVGSRGGYKNFAQAVLACGALKDLSLYIVGGGPLVGKRAATVGDPPGRSVQVAGLAK